MKSKTYKKKKKLLDIYDDHAILDKDVDEFLFGQDDEVIIEEVDIKNNESYD